MQDTKQQNGKQQNKILEFSTDYDMSMVIKYSFGLFAIFLLQLFILQVIHDWRGNSTGDGYLTPEITHTIFGFIGGWIAAIVTFLAKRLADQVGASRANPPTEKGEK